MTSGEAVQPKATTLNLGFLAVETRQPALEAERLAWIQETVAAAVKKILGQDLAPEKPLMSAGLDSLGVTSHQQLNSWPALGKQNDGTVHQTFCVVFLMQRWQAVLSASLTGAGVTGHRIVNESASPGGAEGELLCRCR